MSIPIPPIPADHTEPTHDERGFHVWPVVTTSYGAKVEVRESSTAEHPHVWLTITEPDDLNAWVQHRDRYDGGWHSASAHMSVEAAQALIDQLAAAIEDT